MLCGQVHTTIYIRALCPGHFGHRQDRRPANTQPLEDNIFTSFFLVTIATLAPYNESTKKTFVCIMVNEEV